MSYEWEEELPQPKPPTVRLKLFVGEAGPNGGLMVHAGSAAIQRAATQADIARALGVTEGQLAEFLDIAKHGSAKEREMRDVITEANRRASESAAAAAYALQPQARSIATAFGGQYK